MYFGYIRISNIKHNRSQILIDSRLILQLPVPNPLKPGVELRMKMKLEKRLQALLLKYIWMSNNCIAYKGASYITDLTVPDNFSFCILK